MMRSIITEAIFNPSQENLEIMNLGSDLLQQIESTTISKGFSGSHLETTEFQAVDFYNMNGYEIFRELKGKPKDLSWFFMKKNLTQITRTALCEGRKTKQNRISYRIRLIPTK